MKTAIMVDGAYYQKRMAYLLGAKSPDERAEELMRYVHRHLFDGGVQTCELYRIFYYDCPPSEKTVFHPLTQKNVDLKKSALYAWSKGFHNALMNKRKVAIRLGELLESSAGYVLTSDALKRLCRNDIGVSDLTEQDFYLDIKQKGVDMRIGLDTASLAQKRLVDQIVLIAGDSDFVPAAKHARREGIDFILDPLWQNIKPSLNEHIDGLRTRISKPPNHISDPLYKGNKNIADDQSEN
ncbi:MAG: NYN domain-containing protein [Oscillospiraceae bacterium]|jgi:uncharacterized LabA/DUF88 family protein|nr:NYN domain-containing protein [Oscillospiraceae bacterium]